ncbi:hypothetical protein DYY88_01825 [Leptolyngbya iicbica LK]|uniref:Pentapeptide repeat-containing protein n=2 Tax=Leptolyngbya TaxID=47251 RepID=A0A4Q7EJP4_9CYAN|nr:hypothetical protein DYY88_01825 [Leptolyngbya sp. LK]
MPTYKALFFGMLIYKVLNFNRQLQQANLQDADLQDANLEFVNLAGADLRRVSYLTEEQLAEAILCGTKLPDYIELDGNRDCNTP